MSGPAPLTASASFLDAATCREHHRTLKAAGYAVGKIEKHQPSTYAVTKNGATWSFRHEHAAGDAISVMAHIMRGASDADHEWLARQWPDAYTRIGQAMTVAVVRTVLLTIFIWGGAIIGTLVLLRGPAM